MNIEIVITEGRLVIEDSECQINIFPNFFIIKEINTRICKLPRKVEENGNNVSCYLCQIINTMRRQPYLSYDCILDCLVC